MLAKFIKLIKAWLFFGLGERKRTALVEEVASQFFQATLASCRANQLSEGEAQMFAKAARDLYCAVGTAICRREPATTGDIVRCVLSMNHEQFQGWVVLQAPPIREMVAYLHQNAILFASARANIQAACPQKEG
jgi:hypothetical protein